jgi:TATA-binding protein-associated factor Taf7
MARGWESKSVEAQQEAATDRPLESPDSRQDNSPQARARRERLAGLRMSRSRILQQMETAVNPKHREMLQRALRALEAELEHEQGS